MPVQVKDGGVLYANPASRTAQGALFEVHDKIAHGY